MIADSPVYPHGVVVGRYLLALADSAADTDRLSDFTAASGTVTFTPVSMRHIYSSGVPATVLQSAIQGRLDAQGYLVDPVGNRGVHLITGVYQVAFMLTGATVPAMEIQVTEAHTEESPLDLTLYSPVPIPPGYKVVVSEALTLRAEAAADRAEAATVSAETLEPIISSYLEGTETRWSEVTEKPTSYPPESHNHDGVYAPVVHSHAEYVLTSDSRLTDTRTPKTHNHPISAITNLQATLDGKQASGSYVLASDSRLTDARPPTTHGHSIGDVVGLRAELDSIEAAPAGTITAVSASAVASNVAPTVTLGGTPTERTLAFGIPAGAKGDSGAAGTITSVTATALNAGAAPTVSLGGTASARTIALGIPKGDPGTSIKGDPGKDGVGVLLVPTGQAVPTVTVPTLLVRY